MQGPVAAGVPEAGGGTVCLTLYQPAPAWSLRVPRAVQGRAGGRLPPPGVGRGWGLLGLGPWHSLRKPRLLSPSL